MSKLALDTFRFLELKDAMNPEIDSLAKGICTFIATVESDKTSDNIDLKQDLLQAASEIGETTLRLHEYKQELDTEVNATIATSCSCLSRVRLIRSDKYLS